MELRHLRYFVAVSEEGSVTRAAARLRISQPPLSRQIRDLEEELGLQLFERSARSMALTDAGRVFLVEAREVLQRTEEALRVAAALAGGICDEIRVGYAPSLTVEILPRSLRRFEASGSGARVRLSDLSTSEMLEGLVEGDLDVALMIKPSEAMPEGLHFEALREFAVCLAMPPGHPLAAARGIGLRQVARERLVAYSREDYPEYHAWLSKLFRRQASKPQISEEHDSATSLIASVEAGRGVALVQQGFECLSGPRLLVRPVHPPPPPFVVGAAWRAGADSALAEAFLAAVRG